jgi:hypothetical protein
MRSIVLNPVLMLREAGCEKHALMNSDVFLSSTVGRLDWYGELDSLA